MCKLNSKLFLSLLVSLFLSVSYLQPLFANSYTQETDQLRLMELKSQLQQLKNGQQVLRPTVKSLKTNSKLLLVAMRSSNGTQQNLKDKSESSDNATETLVTISKQPVELLLEVNNQLQTFKNTLNSQLTDLQTNYYMSQEDLAKAKEATERQLQQITEMEHTISELKTALSSNKEDTSVALSLAGDLFSQVQLLENDIAKLKYHTSELENNIAIMEQQIKNSYITGTVFSTTFSLGLGGYMIYEGMKTGNTPLYISGIVVAVAPTIVYQGGHWIMKWW